MSIIKIQFYNLNCKYIIIFINENSYVHNCSFTFRKWTQKFLSFKITLREWLSIVSRSYSLVIHLLEVYLIALNEVIFKNWSYNTVVPSFQSRSIRMQVLWIKAWHQDGGSADDRRGRTTLLVRMRPIRIVQKSVWRCHAIHHVGIRRMPRNHELKYLALYPRQSPVDPCVIRSPSDIFIVYSLAVYSPAVAIIVNMV